MINNQPPENLVQPANLSAAVVDKHFDWLRDYGLDGVLVQRFVTRLRDPENSLLLLRRVRDAARRTGRVFAVEYDSNEDLVLWRIMGNGSEPAEDIVGG